MCKGGSRPAVDGISFAVADDRTGPVVPRRRCGRICDGTATTGRRSCSPPSTWRKPTLLAVSLLQPLAWLALFSQKIRGLAADPAFRAHGYHDYLSFITPSMLVLSMLFTALQSGTATMADIDTEMMDKLLTSPVPR